MTPPKLRVNKCLKFGLCNIRVLAYKTCIQVLDWGGGLRARAQTCIYQLGNIYESCQEALSNSYGQDCLELQFGSRRGIFMLSHNLTVSISHSFK